MLETSSGVSASGGGGAVWTEARGTLCIPLKTVAEKLQRRLVGIAPGYGDV